MVAGIAAGRMRFLSAFRQTESGMPYFLNQKWKGANVNHYPQRVSSVEAADESKFLYDFTYFKNGERSAITIIAHDSIGAVCAGLRLLRLDRKSVV